MKKPFLVLLLFVFSFSLLFSRDYKGKGRVVGYVFDEDGEPLEGVKVKLFSLRAQAGFEVVSNNEGKWVGSWIRGGSWNIDFEKSGYLPRKITIEVQEYGRNPEITINLEKVEGLVLTDELKEELYQGNLLFEIKNMRKQSLLTRKILDKEPQNSEILLLIGNCHANRGDNEQALVWYDRIDFEKIGDPTVLYNIGTNYYNISRFEQALKYYKKAVEMSPAFLDGLYQLGLTYLTMGEYQESVKVFENYLEHDADSPRSAQVKNFLDFLKKKNEAE